MSEFRFHLDKVLKVRQNQTTLAKHALATAQLKAAQAWVEMEKARNARQAYEQQMDDSRQNRMKAGEMAAQTERHEELARIESEAAGALHEALANVAAKRAELEEAQRKEKALEKLRESQLEVFQHQELAEEQMEIDEMAQNVRRGRKGDDWL